jgi:hypothetical protein
MTLANMPERPVRSGLFGPRPLIEGEDTAGYDELLAGISGAVKPSDILEEIWVRDVVDLVWDTWRLRRLKANLMNAAACQGLQRVLCTLLDDNDSEYDLPRMSFERDPAETLARKWARRDRDAIKQVDQLLAAARMTMDTVMAQTLSLALNDIERIDRMIMTTEARRSAILREIDRHRAAFGQQLRLAAHDAEDAEFKVIAANSADGDRIGS